MRVATFKHTKVVLALLIIISISFGRCQEDDEDEEEYEEDNVDDATTKRYRLRTSSTTTTTTASPDPPASGRNETTQDGGSNSTEKAAPSGASASNSSPGGASPAVAAAAVTSAPSTRAPNTYPTPGTRGTTPADSEEEIETTTEEEGLGYVFRPLNSLIDNIVAGNVSGIVDHALSIRTPPEIRDFVNHVMNNIFGVGIGSALRQFMPSLFTTSAPQVSAGRDPIPNQEPSQVAAPAPAQIAIPIQAIIDARSNASEDGKQSKTQHGPLQLKFSHPGAPASRLRCEVIPD